LKTRKKPETAAAGAAGGDRRTIVLVGCDPLVVETIRASLKGSPFHFLAADQVPEGTDAELVVLPAREAARLAAPAGKPLVAASELADAEMIAYGPPGLLRAAFMAGCADYLREPWTAQELALRAEIALSRRSRGCEFGWGWARWDGDTLCTPGGPVALTRQQALLLRALIRRRGSPVPRNALAALLGTVNVGGRSLDVQVSQIRRRVRDVVPAAGRFIVCVRGKGYLLP